MIIADLDYIESISINGTNIVGGAVGVVAEAEASATGNDTLAATQTDTKVKDYGLFQIGFGQAKANAIGDSATANTSVTGSGRGGRSATYNGQRNLPSGKKLATSLSFGVRYDF